jgi:hypothetical protein
VQAEPSLVTLKATAEVSGERILLGDLAEIKGNAALSQIDVGPAPLPGRSRTVRRGSVAVQVRAAGIADADVSFTGADKIRVTRRARSVTAEELCAALGQQLKTPVELACVPPLPQIPDGELSISLLSLPPLPLPEQTSVTCQVCINGQPYQRLTVAIRPTLATAANPTGTTPAPASTQPPPLPPQPGGTKGGASGRPEPLVKRNEQVLVISRCGAVQVKVTGTARESGALGALISVRVPATGSTLRGRVSGPGQVDVVAE